MENFDDALNYMVTRMNEHMEHYYRREKSFADDPKMWIDRCVYTLNVGRKYVKIVREGSVVAFVEKETGNIFKPASWQAPAKGVRGNIFSDKKGMEALNFDSVGLVFVKYAANYAKS